MIRTARTKRIGRTGRRHDGPYSFNGIYHKDARRRPARTDCWKEGEEIMKRLNTSSNRGDVLEINVKPGTKIRSALPYKPCYEIPTKKDGKEPAHVPRTYRRIDIALALQGELERRFIALCEALFLDGLCNTYSDVTMITEAVARYKEVFYLMEQIDVPPNFIYNTPAAYCEAFHIFEADVMAAIMQNGEYMANNNGMPTADTMPLREYLEELNNSDL